MEGVGLREAAVADVWICLESNRLGNQLRLWLRFRFRFVSEEVEYVDVGWLGLHTGGLQSQIHERLLLFLWLDRIASNIENVHLLLHRHWLLRLLLEVIDVEDVLWQRWFFRWLFLSFFYFFGCLCFFPHIAVQLSEDKYFWFSIFLQILEPSIGLLY